MPLNIRVSNPAAYADAILPVVQSLDEIIAGLPGLVGAWDATDYTAGDWIARIGSGRITLTGATKATQGGRDVISFVAASRGVVKDAAGAAVVPPAITFAERAWFGNVTANFQKVLDMGAPELFFRPTLGAGPCWQWAPGGGEPAGTRPLEGGAVARWRQFVFSKQGTDAAIFDADGGAAVALGVSGVALTGATALVVGDQASSAAIKSTSRLLICTSGALTPEQRASVNAWLGM